MNLDKKTPLSIPFYKAKISCGDEWAEGHYLPNYWLEGIGRIKDIILEDSGYHRDVHYIDKDTLQITFNGEDWFPLKELKNIIDQYIKTKA